MSHVAVHLKRTQHCKSTIFHYKIKVKFKKGKERAQLHPLEVSTWPVRNTRPGPASPVGAPFLPPTTFAPDQVGIRQGAEGCPTQHPAAEQTPGCAGFHFCRPAFIPAPFPPAPLRSPSPGTGAGGTRDPHCHCAFLSSAITSHSLQGTGSLTFTALALQVPRCIRWAFSLNCGGFALVSFRLFIQASSFRVRGKMLVNGGWQDHYKYKTWQRNVWETTTWSKRQQTHTFGPCTVCFSPGCCHKPPTA